MGGALSPDSDVVINGLRVEKGEVDVDPVPRGDSDGPHAVLEVWVLGRMPRGVYGAIQGGDISTAES